MKENTGCYKCLKCGKIFRVNTYSRHQGYTYPKVIHECCFCDSKDIVMISKSEFRSIKKPSFHVIKNDVSYTLIL